MPIEMKPKVVKDVSVAMAGTFTVDLDGVNARVLALACYVDSSNDMRTLALVGNRERAIGWVSLDSLKYVGVG